MICICVYTVIQTMYALYITDDFVQHKCILKCMNYLISATNILILCFAGAVHPGHAAPLCIQSS